MSTARMPGRRSHAIEPDGVVKFASRAEMYAHLRDTLPALDTHRAECMARLAVVNAEHRVGRIEALVYVLVVIGAVVASALWPGAWF